MTPVFIRGDVVYHPADKCWGVVDHWDGTTIFGWWSAVSQFDAKSLALKGLQGNPHNTGIGYYGISAEGVTHVRNDEGNIQILESLAAKADQDQKQDEPPSKFKPGYHLTPIAKGELGQISKILEEADELQDAADQGIKVMILTELSDLYGAIDAYLNKHFPGITMTDLAAMSLVTKRAFDNGGRK